MKKVSGKIIVAGRLRKASTISHKYLIGDSACGKTALIQMYTTNGQTFLKDYNMTQGAEVSSKIIPFAEKDKDVELFFFDISGQECYQSITNELIGNASLIAIVYDCTNSESFQKVQHWYDKLKQKNSKPMQGVLISTKNDLGSARTVDPAQGKDIAKKLNLAFFEVSAARNTNIDLPFINLAERLI